MPVPARYDAFWVPGLQHEIDRDESLRAGFAWLASAERAYGGRGVIVMYATSMVTNAALLGQASCRWPIVSPRSKRPAPRGPVLAIWPPDYGVLEFAENLALDKGLCVVSGRFDLSPWIAKTGAKCLIDGYDEEPGMSDVPSEVAVRLDHMLSFDGRNGFIGAGGKEDAIRQLQAIARRANRPAPEAVEAHLVASGKTTAHGASQARKWYEEIMAGRHHRDYAGRLIT